MVFEIMINIQGSRIHNLITNTQKFITQNLDFKDMISKNLFHIHDFSYFSIVQMNSNLQEEIKIYFRT